MKQLSMIVTHLINERILNEYIKMQKSGIDTILLIDNTNSIIEKNKKVDKLNWNGNIIQYCLFNENDFRELDLPFCCFNEKSASFTKTAWYNCDYFFYISYKNFPEYDFYWRFDYDCIYNDESYSSFFLPYNENTSDLIAPNIAQPKENWAHNQQVSWLYPYPDERRCSFCPTSRLSKRAINLLYKRRREIYDNFLKINNSNISWPNVELFVPTEIYKNKLTYANIINLGIFRYKPSLTIEEQCIFNTYDKKLYHPLK